MITLHVMLRLLLYDRSTHTIDTGRHCAIIVSCQENQPNLFTRIARYARKIFLSALRENQAEFTRRTRQSSALQNMLQKDVIGTEDPANDLPRKKQSIRSEEHTSELQSQ